MNIYIALLHEINTPIHLGLPIFHFIPHTFVTAQQAVQQMEQKKLQQGHPPSGPGGELKFQPRM